MMAHPEMTRILAQEHRADLLCDAEHERLLSAARRHRRMTQRRRK